MSKQHKAPADITAPIGIFSPVHQSETSPRSLTGSWLGSWRREMTPVPANKGKQRRPRGQSVSAFRREQNRGRGAGSKQRETGLVSSCVIFFFLCGDTGSPTHMWVTQLCVVVRHVTSAQGAAPHNITPGDQKEHRGKRETERKRQRQRRRSRGRDRDQKKERRTHTEAETGRDTETHMRTASRGGWVRSRGRRARRSRGRRSCRAV